MIHELLPCHASFGTFEEKKELTSIFSFWFRNATDVDKHAGFT